MSSAPKTEREKRRGVAGEVLMWKVGGAKAALGGSLESGINVYRSYVGNYFTSLEMMGITITLMKLDQELKALVDLECEGMGLTQLQRNG